MLLYYIRHGETDWNREGRLQGQRDIPINTSGRAQATRCGEVLRELFARAAVDAARLDFVASPLGRARETMQLARGALGLDPMSYRTDARLAEVSFGAWEGCTTEELRAHAPDAVAARESDKWNFTPPQAESYFTMSLRVHDLVPLADARHCRGRAWRDLSRADGAARHRASGRSAVPDVAQGVVYVIDPAA